jgi:hypothetical protein
MGPTRERLSACFSLSHKGFDVSYCEINRLAKAGSLLRIGTTRADLGLQTCRMLYLTMRDGLGFVRQAGLFIGALGVNFRICRMALGRAWSWQLRWQYG